MSISCQYWYPVIPPLHCLHHDVVDIMLISCQYHVNLGTLSPLAHHTSFSSLTLRCRRYHVDFGNLQYLVYIVHIVDIAMLMISCRHRYPVIPCLQHNIADIAMLTISFGYRVNICTLSYLDDIVSKSCPIFYHVISYFVKTMFILYNHFPI